MSRGDGVEAVAQVGEVFEGDDGRGVTGRGEREVGRCGGHATHSTGLVWIVK